MNARRLAALRVGNFKAFSDTQRIPLKPITLIFGPNSAGKSSFIHSLALAHEAMRSGKLDVFRTEIGGTSIDLGGFRQYVHRGQLSRRVEWGAEIHSTAFGDEIAEKLSPTRTILLSVTFGMELDDQDRPKPNAQPFIISVDITDGAKELLHASRRPRGEYRIDRLNFQHHFLRNCAKEVVGGYSPGPAEAVDDETDSLIREIEKVVPQLSLITDRLLPKDIATPDSWYTLGPDHDRPHDGVIFFIDEQLRPFLNALFAAVATTLESFQYLGPLRSYPARHLAFSDHDDPNWYAGGGFAWDVVRRDDKVREAVNRWLGDKTRLSTPYELRIRHLLTVDSLDKDFATLIEQLEKRFTEKEYDWDLFGELYGALNSLKGREPELSDIHDLVLVDQRSGTPVSHRDVGIGISQVLPVLVMAYASQQKILAIEQPEIHLHPALQAELADVFIEGALGERKNTFILETHSEHLVLRMLRRIRETTDGELPEGAKPLKPEDVQVIYVQPEAAGSRVINIQITLDGEFADKWPEGFFAERAKELF